MRINVFPDRRRNISSVKIGRKKNEKYQQKKFNFDGNIFQTFYK